VRGNVLHGVRLGIHAADCAAVLFEDNLVEATHAGYCQHGGRDHLLRNNIIAGGLTCAAAGPVRPAMLEGNILHGRCEWDDRLLAWRNWHDTPHSSLRDDAPALAYGFGPLDATLAGPRLGDVLPRSADGWDEEPDLPAPIVHCRLQPTAPRAFTLTVENIGAAPALGEIALRVSPADAGTIDGNTELPLALLPGEQAAVPGTVTFRPGHTRLLLETLPRGEGILPTAVYLTTGDNG
jgi:hypothetical protein